MDSQVFADALSAVSSSSSSEESEDEADCGEDEPAMGDGCESSDSTMSNNDAGCESAVEHSVCDTGNIDSGEIPKQGDDGSLKQVNVDNVSESTLNNISINNEQVNDNESTINGKTLKQVNVSDGTINGNTLKQVNVSESTLNNNGISNDNSLLNSNGISNDNSTLKNNDINNDNSIMEHSDNSASNVSETTLKQIDGASVAPSKMRILVLPVRLKWTMNLSKEANGWLMMKGLVMTSLHLGRM